MSNQWIAEQLARAAGYTGPSGKKNMDVRCWVHGDDNRPSLSIAPGDKHPIIMECHKGCSYWDLKSAAKEKGWWPEEAEPQKKSNTKVRADGKEMEYVNFDDPRLGRIYYTKVDGEPAGAIQEVYYYEKPDGSVAHINIRFVPKDFRQGGIGPNGRYQAHTKGIEMLLWNLPAVIETAKKGGTVYLCEGEKDAKNAKALGLCSTTMPMGAGKKKWKPEWTQFLIGSNVVIFADDDKPDKKGRRAGLEHAHGVANTLTAAGIKCKVVLLPSVFRKGIKWPVKDLSDFLGAGGTKEELREIILKTKPWTIESIPADIAPYVVPQRAEVVQGNTEDSKSWLYLDTDLMNVERYLAQHPNKSAYTKAAGYRFYNGAYWEMDERDQVLELCRQTCVSIRKEVSKTTLEHRVVIEKHAKKCQDESKIRTLHRAIRSRIAMLEEEFDSEATAHLLNCKNGTINLQTGELQDHNPMDYITKYTDIDYKPGAPCPKWKNHFDLVFKRNQDLIGYVKRALGFSLFGVLWEHVVFICEGDGANGKGTLTELAYRVLGSYACNTETETFMVSRQNQSIRNDIARLKGARFVLAAEAGEGGTFDDGMIKRMSGGDPLTARFLNKEHFEFWPVFKVWVTCNKKPRTNDTSKGMKRRLKFIPFHAEIPEELWNDRIKEELWNEEREGILAWLVEGAVEWYQGGGVGRKSRLGEPKAVSDEGEEYWIENDIVERFLVFMCDLTNKGSKDVFVEVAVLYKAFTDFCKQNDPNHRVISEMTFSQRVKRKGFPEGRESVLKKRIFYGLCLK